MPLKYQMGESQQSENQDFEIGSIHVTSAAEMWLRHEPKDENQIRRQLSKVFGSC
jgi:hypothetical protein